MVIGLLCLLMLGGGWARQWGEHERSPENERFSSHQATKIIINEVVTDPQQDWNDSQGGNGIPFDSIPGSGTITSTDEWVEILNISRDTLDLTVAGGWKLVFLDTTPETLFFANPGRSVEFVLSRGGSITGFLPGEYLVIGNPPGSINNDVYIQLIDASDQVVDDVELGDDPEGDGIGDGAPDGGPGGGNATGIDDEAIARIPNASDTDDDVHDFVQKDATIGRFNVSRPCFTYAFNRFEGGWYLISLPVIPDQSSIDNLFPGAAAAFSWDFLSQSYVRVSEVQPGNAYWILYLDTASVEICGLPIEHYSRSYNNSGWAMSGAVVSPGLLLSQPPDNVLAMFAWDAVNQNYIVMDSMLVEPGHGYWIMIQSYPTQIYVIGNLTRSQQANALTRLEHPPKGSLRPPPSPTTPNEYKEI